MLLHKKALEIRRAATDDSRYQLCGVHILPDGSAVATNGHILIEFKPAVKGEAKEYPAVQGVTIEDVEGSKPLVPFTLPVDACVALQRAMPKKSPYPIITDYIALDVAKTNANGNAVMAINTLDNAQLFTPKKVEGQFPDYKKVMPEDKTIEAWAGFSVDYLQTVLATMKACGVEAVKFGIRDQLKPATIKGVDKEQNTITAVVMPRRME